MSVPASSFQTRFITSRSRPRHRYRVCRERKGFLSLRVLLEYQAGAAESEGWCSSESGLEVGGAGPQGIGNSIVCSVESTRLSVFLRLISALLSRRYYFCVDPGPMGSRRLSL